MAADPTAIEQAVSRTLRDNLGKIQRTAEELHQAVSDLISACASSRPSNALPSMVRAQTSAASLSATLEVLSRLVTSALQPAMRSPFEPEILQVPSMGTTASAVPNADPYMEPVVDTVVDDGVDHAATDVVTYTKQLEPPPAHLMDEKPWAAPTSGPTLTEESPAAEIHSSAETSPHSDMQPPFEMPPVIDAVGDSVRDFAGGFSPAVEPVFLSEPVPVFVREVVPPVERVDAPETHAESDPAESAHLFSLDALPPEEQELHRRAFRVAKVSMQDIKMLRPDDVRLGRDNKDLCFRLRDDIEKAHKEYDRRFQSIQSHPVDYFYDWMVEILAGGDSQALGEYPYPSPVLRR